MRDILFLAKDRRTFTEMTFGWLLENTNWDLVNRLIVYDDGSTDGTREWLRDIVRSYRESLDALRAGLEPELGASRRSLGGAFTRGHFARPV